MVKKTVKRLIGIVLVCCCLVYTYSTAQAAAALGSKTKSYSNGKGSITVLSDIKTDQYSSYYFYKGSLYYQTKCNMHVKCSGYYIDIYGYVREVTSAKVAEASANTVTSYAYYSAENTPVCNSTYKNKAVGYSVGGDIRVTRPAS